MHDGSLFGTSYFSCPDKHGVFCQLSELGGGAPAPAAAAPAYSAAPVSTPMAAAASPATSFSVGQKVHGQHPHSVVICFSLTEAPLPDPNPDPTQHPETDPKQTRNGPKRTRNGPKSSSRGFVGVGGRGVVREKENHYPSVSTPVDFREITIGRGEKELEERKRPPSPRFQFYQEKTRFTKGRFRPCERPKMGLRRQCCGKIDREGSCSRAAGGPS